MPSQAFKDFHYSCFDTSFPAVHDGLNAKALLSLEGDERAEAARLIVAAIPGTKESRPIIAAGYLGMAGAVPLLRSKLLNTDSRELKIWTAWAIHRIESDPNVVTVILNILRSADPDKEFYHWCDGLSSLDDFPLTAEILVELLELVVRVRPDLLLTKTIQTYFGYRRLGDYIVTLWERPSHTTSHAIGVWNELPMPEKRRLEDALVEKLTATRSSLIAIVLGLLRATAAASTIRDILQTGDEHGRSRCALALYNIDGWSGAAEVCLALLFSYHEQQPRLLAMEALLNMSPTLQTAVALIEIIEDDRDPVLRRYALSTLSLLFPAEEMIEELARNAGAFDYSWPPGSNWRQPTVDEMSTLRAAIERAFNGIER